MKKFVSWIFSGRAAFKLFDSVIMAIFVIRAYETFGLIPTLIAFSIIQIIGWFLVDYNQELDIQIAQALERQRLMEDYHNRVVNFYSDNEGE